MKPRWSLWVVAEEIGYARGVMSETSLQQGCTAKEIFSLKLPA